MAQETIDLEHFEVHPLTSQRWLDLERLFGPRGATGGCWCMFWRLKRSEYELMKGEGNRALLRGLTNSGQVPGLIGYVNGEPAGWVALGPREDFDTLERSRILKRVDEHPVWSVVCFFVGKLYRRSGLTLKLLKAAAEYARSQGASILEAYPVEPQKDNMPPVFAYTGFVNTFKQAGFEEVERRSETRPIMRLNLADEAGQ
jgi:GNAT superfamily N-acetyltransferase